MGDLEEPYRACLEVKGAAGTVAVVAVPVLIISLVVVLFLRWQFKASHALPVPPLVPDLQGKVEPPSRIKCLVFNWFPAVSMLPCCSIPFIPRPLEYIGTGMWQGFIFTWPYQPRWVEPLMTNTGRESVSLICIALQIMFFICGGSVASLILESFAPEPAGATCTSTSSSTDLKADHDACAAVTGEALATGEACWGVLSNQTSVAGEQACTYVAQEVDEEAGNSQVYIAMALGVVNIYLVSIVQMVAKLVLGMVYAVAAKKGAGVAKALSVVSGVFFGFVIITIVGVLNVFSCNDFFANIILPFGLRQPLTLLLAPLTFIILASLGSGATVEDMQEVYARVDEMDDKQLGERLGELGQGPFLRGGPKWDLQKFQGEDAADTAAAPEGGIVATTERSTEELRAMLKEAVYTVEASQMFAKVDKLADVNYPNRELYPHWKGDAAAAAFEMQEAGLKKELEGLLGIMDENEFHPWVVPRADAYAAAGKELKDSTGAASLDEDVSEDDLRSLVRELIWMKTTTVPAMWGIVQGDGSLAGVGAEDRKLRKLESQMTSSPVFDEEGGSTLKTSVPSEDGEDPATATQDTEGL